MGTRQTKRAANLGHDGYFKGDLLRFLPEFLEYLRAERAYSVYTQQAYARDIQDYCAYVASQVIAADTLDALRMWVMQLRRANLAVSSIRRKIAALRSFWNYLQRAGYLQHNPCRLLVPPKADKKVLGFLSTAQMQELMAKTKAQVEQLGLETLENLQTLESGENGKSGEPKPVALTDTISSRTLYTKALKELFMPMFYLTGMRLAELVELKDWQVDIAQRQILVQGKGGKPRYVPFGEDLARQLQHYQKLRNQRFAWQSRHAKSRNFWLNYQGRPLNRMFVYREIRSRLAELGRANGSPHLLRHTFATQLLNAGADLHAIKTLLGHSSLLATQIYTHTHIDKLKEVYRKAHPLAAIDSECS